MPNYQYNCTACGYIFEEQLPMKERANPTNENCPQCGENKVVIGIPVPNIVDSYRIGVKKPPKGFQELLTNIKKNNHGSTIET